MVGYFTLCKSRTASPWPSRKRTSSARSRRGKTKSNEPGASSCTEANALILAGSVTSTMAHEKSRIQSGIFISHKSNRALGCGRGVRVVEAEFLTQHGVFRRFNPNAESRPAPPDHKEREHNC